MAKQANCDMKVRDVACHEGRMYAKDGETLEAGWRDEGGVTGYLAGEDREVTE